MTGRDNLLLLWPEDWTSYELLDSGDGRRFERYGTVTLVRPEPNALWRPRRPATEWESADATFDPQASEAARAWRGGALPPHGWPLDHGALRFEARLTPFRHTGIFPEQAVNWQWCADQILAAPEAPNVLHLFAYTGIGTLAAAAAGAKVTHVDASRPAMGWARKNQRLSAMEEAPIRWLVDDVVKFVRREVRRGRQYEGIILDPPAFGRGPKGEIWRFSEGLPALLEVLAALLSPEARFFLLNAYAVTESAVVLRNLVEQTVGGRGGTLEAGELALRESGRDGRLLPTSLFARWSR